MCRQSFEVTEAMFKHFQLLADFIDNDATEDEAMALLALISPLTRALYEKVGHRDDVKTGN